MKSKLNYLIGVSFKRKIKSKWFYVVNILLFVVLMVLANIDSIINLFGGDFDKKQEIYVIDNTDISYDIFKNQLMVTTGKEKEEDMDYIVKLYEEEISVDKFIEENNDYLVIEFNEDLENTLAVKIYSKEYIDLIDSQYLSNSLYNTKVMIATMKSEIDPDILQSIYSNIEIERVIYDEEKNSVDENMSVIMTTVFPFFILPFFMLIIFIVQMIGAEINDEKTTRGMEIIISSVSPTTHFFSKIIASNLFVIIQGILLFIYGGVGLTIRKFVGGDTLTSGIIVSVKGMFKQVANSSFMDQLVYIIPITLILMLLTFLAYSLLAGILASMTTNTEDFQQLQTPIVIVLLIGYYLSILAGTFKGAVIIKILSMVPFISAILAPSLLVIGEIGILEIVIAIVLMIVTILLLIKYGLRVYKVGILNYSSTNLWKKMAKAVKTK